jgi:hypothetical protein
LQNAIRFQIENYNDVVAPVGDEATIQFVGNRDAMNML